MSSKNKLRWDIITCIARRNLPKNHLPSELDIVSFYRFSVKTEHFLPHALVVHFDSKKLKFNRKQTEKIAVVTGMDGFDQIINSVFLQCGTGKAVAEAVFETLQCWNLDGVIIGKCYDTTNVNSGEKNGAAVILERMLGRKLLDLPCRHHIYELVLGTAYKTCFGRVTTSPDDMLFKSFRDEWDRLDKSVYSGFPAGKIAETEKVNIVSFCNRMPLQTHIREDYAEFLELTLVCLDDSKAVTFRRPGALHHARFMAKAIYSLKMYLFRDQFMPDCEKLERFVLFVVLIYIRGWYKAPIATDAPLNDLKFMRALKNYDDKELGQKTYQKFKKHLWYLSELNISLSSPRSHQPFVADAK
ncbi:uncharacterized protein LOC134216805 [Armigeres subalbatus]|uniref:uncharacterized protein LOC134216805 n=1 Tax=Armigeres subalbatus TaxID=124917 RepID=UPI002ECFF9F4